MQSQSADMALHTLMMLASERRQVSLGDGLSEGKHAEKIGCFTGKGCIFKASNSFKIHLPLCLGIKGKGKSE